jgi:hypothetical protein
LPEELMPRRRVVVASEIAADFRHTYDRFTE